jgi:hypothetical protein
MPTKITINRAPVLTLWAAVVAQRLGFRWDEALSLGKALAGLNAQAKGRRLGIFKPHEQKPKNVRDKPHGEEFRIELCGRSVPARNTADGVRAVAGTRVVTAESAEAYINAKFGDDLDAARVAMTRLARALKPRELAVQASRLCEEFRPSVPESVKGWGAKGVLDLNTIAAMVRT